MNNNDLNIEISKNNNKYIIKVLNINTIIECKDNLSVLNQLSEIKDKYNRSWHNQNEKNKGMNIFVNDDVNDKDYRELVNQLNKL